MYTTYHFQSAKEISFEFLDAIKVAFQSKPIMITVEEEVDENAYLMSNPANKAMILQSIAQDKTGETLCVQIPDA